jgi:hypothetical protein
MPGKGVIGVREPARVYRWHPLLRLFALAFSVGMLILGASLIVKPVHEGQPYLGDWIIAGVMGLIALCGQWINAEQYVVTEQGVEQRVLWWKHFVRWDAIQELQGCPSERDEMGLGGFSVFAKPTRPSHGKPLDLQLQVFNLMRGSGELKSLIIQRAHLAKVSSDEEGEIYRRLE